MEALLDTLREVIERTRVVVADGLGGGQIRRSADGELLDAMVLAGELTRLADALLIESTGEVARRSESPDRDTRLTTRMGCHDVSELVQRLTRLAPASAGRLQRAAKAVTVDESILGEQLPPVLPAMRAALIDGDVGLDGVLAVAGPLAGLGDRVGRELVLTADAVLAAEARGEGPDAAPPACADLLRLQAQVWAAALDQDGAEPRETTQLRRRFVRLGRARADGLVPFEGLLLPEVAAQWQRINDAVCSPRIDPDGPVQFRPTNDYHPAVPTETRTRAQQQHDALATALFVAASSELLPTIGGAAPTLVVAARAEDVTAGTGWAQVDGCEEPVSIAAALHAGCAGVVLRVLVDADNGRIHSLGTEERVFNRRQRRAIALRDGGCIIPGCGVPAAWCEIHHVLEHANGGKTHTDNGVMLCWFHHRFLDLHGWEIRMNRGIPEVRAPLWFDPTRQWRAVTKSKPRLLDLIDLQY